MNLFVQNLKKKIRSVGSVGICLLLQGCGMFSFSSGTLSSAIQTFSLETFQTEIAEGPIDLKDQLTEELADRIQNMTNVTRVEKDGDIQFEGVIKSFSYTSIAASSNNESSREGKERLTIRVEVSYHNTTDKEASFTKKTFYEYADTETSAGRDAEESGLVEAIVRKLAESIAAKSIDRW